MVQPSSGTYAFNPSFGDLLLESFSRAQIRPTSLTADHMFQARMSANLLLAEWATKPAIPNLWKVELLSIPLTQGNPTYSVPTNVVAILDYYVRQYQIGNPVSLTSAFSTTASSASVKITYASNGQVPGAWVSVSIPVAIGGIVVQGFYQVTSVIDANNFTITAASAATGTVNAGGVVPTFTTATQSSVVTVALTNHGLVANQNFTVQVPVQVGGLTLSGVYAVTTVLGANSFTITAPQPAGSVATVAENGGAAQLQVQLPNTQPQDRVIFPISRTEYASQPNKADQAYPTTVWWDRTINSTLTLWPTPDQNGPYVLYFYAMTQIQDATLPNAATLDLPYRFFEAFAAGLAAKLARKFPPPPSSGVTVAELRAEAQQAWDGASQQDTENVPLFISPGLSRYSGGY